MTSNDWPPYIIAICGCLFVLIGVLYPRLPGISNTDRRGAGQRQLSFVLGFALLALWGIWLGAS